ncbi:hypothetical protein BJX96DRAFT_142351 [Aspergillus floccosus]
MGRRGDSADVNRPPTRLNNSLHLRTKQIDAAMKSSEEMGNGKTLTRDLQSNVPGKHEAQSVHD